jgi:hypothetical protein
MAAVWISIIDNTDGGRDVEVLDAPPAASFLADLAAAVHRGGAYRAEIREGNVNGGDSIVIESFPADPRASRRV